MNSDDINMHKRMDNPEAERLRLEYWQLLSKRSSDDRDAWLHQRQMTARQEAVEEEVVYLELKEHYSERKRWIVVWQKTEVDGQTGHAGRSDDCQMRRFSTYEEAEKWAILHSGYILEGVHNEQDS